MHGIELLKKGLNEIGIEISETQKKQFLLYYKMLVERNKVMNLTAITELDEVMVKHFLDSLLMVKTMPFNAPLSLIDVGTGAGFPGIPIKIIYPQLSVTLLDSLNKRVSFLKDVVKELELKDIVALHGRAEDFGRNKEYRETFDVCVSRAVANLSSLSEYCIPFIKKGGKFVSYKSSISQEEIDNAKNAIKVLGGEIIANNTYDLPCSNIKRTFVIIEKKKETPKKYPRKAGTPTKEPIS